MNKGDGIPQSQQDSALNDSIKWKLHILSVAVLDFLLLVASRISGTYLANNVFAERLRDALTSMHAHAAGQTSK